MLADITKYGPSCLMNQRHVSAKRGPTYWTQNHYSRQIPCNWSIFMLWTNSPFLSYYLKWNSFAFVTWFQGAGIAVWVSESYCQSATCTCNIKPLLWSFPTKHRDWTKLYLSHLYLASPFECCNCDLRHWRQQEMNKRAEVASSNPFTSTVQGLHKCSFLLQ